MTKLPTRVVTRKSIIYGGYISYKELAERLRVAHGDRKYSVSAIHDLFRNMTSAGRLTDEFRRLNTCKAPLSHTRYISIEFADKILAYWAEKQQKKRKKPGPKERASLRQTERDAAGIYFDNMHKPMVPGPPVKTGKYVRPRVQKKNLHFVFKETK